MNMEILFRRVDFSPTYLVAKAQNPFSDSTTRACLKAAAASASVNPCSAAPSRHRVEVVGIILAKIRSPLVAPKGLEPKPEPYPPPLKR